MAFPFSLSEYQPIMQLRLQSATSSVVLVAGFEADKPAAALFRRHEQQGAPIQPFLVVTKLEAR